MRRPGANYPRSRSHLEDENDELTEGLKQKIYSLRNVTVEIGEEVRYQNKYLSEMDSAMEKSTGILQGTMRKVVAMAKAGHFSFYWILTLFAFFVFGVIWLLSKWWNYKKFITTIKLSNASEGSAQTL